MFADVERGAFPRADGCIEAVRPHAGTAVVGFSAHILIAADVTQQWVDDQLPHGDLAEPLNPTFLGTLAEYLDLRVNGTDLVTFGHRLGGPAPIELKEVTETSHPRVARARRYRRDLRIYEAEGGVMVLGRGLAGRWETAFEVDPQWRNRGLGRALAQAARHLIPDGRGVWAQTAPGNAASVRVLLDAGYLPVGAEALLVPADVRGLGMAGMAGMVDHGEN